MQTNRQILNQTDRDKRGSFPKGSATIGAGGKDAPPHLFEIVVLFVFS